MASISLDTNNYIYKCYSIDPSYDGDASDISAKDLYKTLISVHGGSKKTAKFLYEVEKKLGVETVNEIISEMKEIQGADLDKIKAVSERLEHLRSNCIAVGAEVIKNEHAISGVSNHEHLLARPLYSLIVPIKQQTEESKKVSGGFKRNLRFSLFGSHYKNVPEKRIIALINKYKEDCDLFNDVSFKNAFICACKDKMTYLCAKDFLKKGGYFSELYEGGKYNWPKIEIGMNNDETKIAKIIFHELLHYYFDKINAEIRDWAGDDHEVIYPLERRFYITNSLQKGQPPECEEIENIGQDKETIRKYINSGVFFDDYIKDNTWSILELQGYAKYHSYTNNELSSNVSLQINQDSRIAIGEDYLTLNNGVDHTSIFLYCKSAKEFDISKLDDVEVLCNDQDVMDKAIQAFNDFELKAKSFYEFSDKQMKDITSIYEFNAALIIQSYRLALYVSDKYGCTLDEAFARPEYKPIIDKFINNFSLKYSEDNSDPNTAASAIMDQLIKP